MHTSLRVIGVLPDLVVSVVLGLGFCRWASAQATELIGQKPGFADLLAIIGNAHSSAHARSSVG
jgi:hypothetical protein